MKKSYTAIFLLLASTSSFALDTSGYPKISSLKAFGTYLSIYLDNSQAHTCSGKSNTRFQSDVANAHHTAFLLAAFTAGIGVNFKYTCTGNKAIITGIRLYKDT